MGIKNKDTYLANVHAIISNEEKAVQDLSKIKEHVSNTISNDHLNAKAELKVIKAEVLHRRKIKEILNVELEASNRHREKIEKLRNSISKVNSAIQHKVEENNKKLDELVQIKKVIIERINTECGLLYGEKEVTAQTKAQFEQQIEKLNEECYVRDLVISTIKSKIEIFYKREHERVKSLSIQKKRRVRLHF